MWHTAVDVDEAVAVASEQQAASAGFKRMLDSELKATEAAQLQDLGEMLSASDEESYEECELLTGPPATPATPAATPVADAGPSTAPLCSSAQPPSAGPSLTPGPVTHARAQQAHSVAPAAAGLAGVATPPVVAPPNTASVSAHSRHILVKVDALCDAGAKKCVTWEDLARALAITIVGFITR